MNILSINTLFKPWVLGGAEITFQSICKGLSDLGHAVSIASTVNVMEEPQLDLVDGLDVFRIPLKNIYWNYGPSNSIIKRIRWHLKDRFNADMAISVGEILDRVKPDIMITHNLVGFSTSVWAEAHSRSIPVVHVIHDPYLLCPKSNMFDGGRACKRQCFSCKCFRVGFKKQSELVSAVVGVSKYTLDLHLRYGYFSNAIEKIVINNARDIKCLPRNSRCVRSGEKITFGYIGTISESKGVFEFIKACKLLSEEFSNRFDIVIAGKGEKSAVDKLNNEIKGLDAKFLGYTSPDIFFNQVDIVVVPSLWNDTFPGVVFESFAYSCPVIGAARGGLPEMITEGQNGWLYDPEESGALIKIMQTLVADPSLLNKASVRAYESSAYYTDVNRMVGEYDNLIRRINEK